MMQAFTSLLPERLQHPACPAAHQPCAGQDLRRCRVQCSRHSNVPAGSGLHPAAAAAATGASRRPAGQPAFASSSSSSRSCSCPSPWGSSRAGSSCSSGSSRSARGPRPLQAVGSLLPVKTVAAEDKLWIPFKPDFYSSQPVQVHGSFNDWSGPFTLNHDPEAGKVGGVVMMDAHDGVVSFKYQVGDKWFLSREDAAASDNQGCINNTTAGRQTVTFKFPGAIVPPANTHPGYEVHVCGAFTDWQVSIPLKLGPDGDYYAKVALSPGHHTFKFLLDASAGQPSSHTSVGQVVGLPIPLSPSPRSAPTERKATWVVVDWLPVELSPGGGKVNFLNVPPPPIFKVLYHTDFKEAYLHYRIKGQTLFERTRMYHQPDCQGMMVAQFPAPDMSCQLEFSITGTTAGSDKDGNTSTVASSSDDESDVWTVAHLGSSSSGGGSGSSNGRSSSPAQQQLLKLVERDPPGGASQLYTAVHPGVWRLKDGELHLDAAGQLAPLMLCTDLDGTLIEDSGDDNDFVRTADDATRKAAAYFGQFLAPSGGVLVFNTGRSIGMVEGLLAKKVGIMPRPHAIITAVGTKVFLWDVATERWTPDPFYAMLLDEGWDADKVQRLATELRHRYNGQVAVVDDGTEHPHRLSLTMRSDIADRVTKKWSEGLKQQNVAHQMVASIGGDWRFVDCISVLAGKGRAMMYLASRFGIINGDVVAAGDSGNDLLMLGPVDGAYHPAIVMSNSHPEVWEWLNKISAHERSWVYTPKGERAMGLVEGMKGIVAEKLRNKSLALQQQVQKRQLPQQGSMSSNNSGGQSRSVRMVRS